MHDEHSSPPFACFFLVLPFGISSGFLAVTLPFVLTKEGWSAVVSDWQASPATVALVTGTLAGIVSAVGCVIGGWLCDHVGRFSVFFGSGSLLVGLAAMMAAAPHTPTAYRAGVLLYALLMDQNEA